MTHHFHTELRTGTLNRTLTSGWHMRLLEGPAPRAVSGQLIPVSVPGTIHRDLALAGLLTTTPADKNDAQPHWAANCGWEYSLDFPWRGAGDRTAELIFRGLAPTATASINGSPLPPATGQHQVLHDVGTLLIDGLNTLKITLGRRASSSS